MNDWRADLRARGRAVQVSFERLARIDELSVRECLHSCGALAWMDEATAEVLTLTRSSPVEFRVELARWIAALVRMRASNRAPSSVLDWFLDHTYLYLCDLIMGLGGSALESSVRTELTRRGLPADDLAVRAALTSTAVIAIERASSRTPSGVQCGEPLRWLRAIARNVIRGAARLDDGTIRLPRAVVDPDEVGGGVRHVVDDEDERAWLAREAISTIAPKSWEPALIEHVLGDGPGAEQLAQEFGIGLARFYKRATLVRAQLRDVYERGLRNAETSMIRFRS